MKKLIVLYLVIFANAIVLGQDQKQLAENFLGSWKMGQTDVALVKTAKKEIQLIQFTWKGKTRYGVIIPDREWNLEFQTISAKGTLAHPGYALGLGCYAPGVSAPSMFSPSSLTAKGATGIKVRVIDVSDMKCKHAEFTIPLAKAVKVKAEDIGKIGT